MEEKQKAEQVEKRNAEREELRRLKEEERNKIIEAENRKVYEKLKASEKRREAERLEIESKAKAEMEASNRIQEVEKLVQGVDELIPIETNKVETIVDENASTSALKKFIKCQHCTKILMVGSYQKHMADKHNESSIIEAKGPESPLVEANTSINLSPRRNEVNDTPTHYTCKTCGEHFSSRIKCRNHMTTSVKCAPTNATKLSDRESLDIGEGNRNNDHVQRDTVKSPRYACLKCDQDLRCSRDLTKHKKKRLRS